MAQDKIYPENLIFSTEEHLIWKKLYSKQSKNLKNKAHITFLENLEKFSLPEDRIPSLSEISTKLQKHVGWELYPVAGLIDHLEYFTLLSECKFPCATYIRSAGKENLSTDPDIFHEIFGHCTMLLSLNHANFMEKFAKFILTVKEKDRQLFARLIWFTTETGLIKTKEEIKIYGSSILSSFYESKYCLGSSGPILKPFNLVNVFREPYRADILQKVYYVIDNLDHLYDLVNNIDHLYQCIELARKAGEFPPLFPVEHTKYCNIGHCF